MVYRNLTYLILGIILGAVVGALLGILVCDETKRAIMKVMQKKVKLFSNGCKTTSEKAVDTIKSSVNAVKDLYCN